MLYRPGGRATAPTGPMQGRRGSFDLSAGHGLCQHTEPRTSPPTPAALDPQPLDPTALGVTPGFGAGPSRAPGSPVRAIQLRGSCLVHTQWCSVALLLLSKRELATAAAPSVRHVDVVMR